MRIQGKERGRLAKAFKGRRSKAILAAVAAVAAVLVVTQVADASSRRRQGSPKPCATTAAPNVPATSAPASAPASGADPNAGGVPSPGQTEGTVSGGTQNGRRVQNYVGDGQDREATARRTGPCTAPTAPGTPAPAADFLGADCSNSDLAAHTGFQDGNKCVATEFGEVANADKNPTLLITRSPQRVQVGQAFTIQVSTRNLVRDRFLAAGTGGYYKERSFLTAEGLTRGHFHTACRMLSTTRGAPDPAAVPAFFVATQDGGGGANPDVITINVTGMPTAGIAQCAAWAGDASHRIPMMQKANEIPAFDSVRITVS